MSVSAVGTAWFALYVKSKTEEQVSQHLRYKGYEEFLPLYKIRFTNHTVEKQKPLFPGYIFCRLSPGANGLIITTPGVISIVGFGGKPMPVEMREIEALKKVVASGFQSEPCKFLNVGEMVRVEDGPLAGVAGILISVRGQYRLVISVALMGRSVAVELSRSAVKSLGRQSSRFNGGVNSPKIAQLIPNNCTTSDKL
jgi:transcriptional antiterminator NusG